MPTIVDLELLGSQGFLLIGDDAFDSAGSDVSNAGDVNGDGFDDVIVASSYGAVYVIYGQAGGFRTLDLGNLSPPDGFKIVGDSGIYAWNVSAAGDVNGDGFDDIIVGGAYAYGWYYSSLPVAYVIFGKQNPGATVNVSDLSSSQGFGVEGDWQYNYSGFKVASAGDINGDGFDDVMVGTVSDGEVYVLFGKSGGFGAIDLDALTPAQGFEIGGLGRNNSVGFSISGAGDFNGDGYDDLIIGAHMGDQGGVDSGGAFVIFGKASGFGTVDLANLGSAGFAIVGDLAGDIAGYSVSSAGDINNDGYDDLLLGAPFGDSGGNLSGQAYVIFGKASGFATIDLSNLAAGAGFLIQGDVAGDNAGWSVSTAGDVNGDGYGDILIGARSADSGGSNAGLAYLIYGKAGGFGTIDLTNLSSSAGFLIQGELNGDAAGWSVSGAGDIDGDGFDDLVVGAPFSDRSGNQSGAAYVISGKLNFILDAANDFNGDGRSDILWRNDNGHVTNWLGQANGAFAGNGGNAYYGVAGSWQIAGTGDFNGDGRDDILWRNDNGQVTNWLGQANGGFASNDAYTYAVVNSWRIEGVGDFNGDGRDDILWRNDNGQVTSWLGQANGGFVSNDANTYGVANSWQIAGVGDFNGDGRDDVLWRNDLGHVTNWLGQANGAFAGNGANSYYGVASNWQIAGVGDFNGDGRDDILWRNDLGHVTNWLGQANGGFAGNGANAYYGVANNWQIEGVGDYNGDGRDDILWRNDLGHVTDWLGQANGSFAGNGNNSYYGAATSWHVEPDPLL